jgi:hypothetical protein|tara:strand:- start:5794 stop:7206 length:1413 start_codon:yes stop_codon:yes gene_type:complete
LDNHHLVEKLYTAQVEVWLQQQTDAISFVKVINSAGWDEKHSDIEFYVVFLNSENLGSACQRVLICTDVDGQTFNLAAKETQQKLASGFSTLDQYMQLVNCLIGADFDLAQPIPLNSLAIKKPWGQEIWFTGVEERGVCKLTSSNNVNVLLPLLTELLPNTLLAQSHGELILLKILDPLPRPVVGDLYFELHEKKREVYVVTHVDTDAWPDGVGGIRYGFDQTVVASFSSQDELRQSYLSAVEAYEEVRRKLDQLLDAKREQHNFAADDHIAGDIVDSWLQSIDLSLIRAEKERRVEMERFSAIRPLRVGDVVKVPLYTPHSLQHGVRTVEFQTPVYERMILSFAQKVLTQNHWDTKRAVELMDVSEPKEEPFVQLGCADGVVIERIVDFDDFEVQRVSLVAGCHFSLPMDGRYWLAMGVDGELSVDSVTLLGESALLLPKTLISVCFSNNEHTNVTLLLATPKLTEDSC